MSSIPIGVAYSHISQFETRKDRPFTHCSLYALFDGNDLRDSISSKSLMNTQNNSQLFAAIVDIDDQEMIEILNYLSINVFFFHFTTNLFHTASRVLEILKIFPKMNAVAICDDSKKWDCLSKLTEYHPKITMASIFSKDAQQDYYWTSFPISAVFLNELHFSETRSLLPEYRSLISDLMIRHIPVFVSCDMPDFNDYLDSLMHFHSFLIPCSGLYTFMDPLQPLAEHLSSSIYETFEGDQSKYDQYTMAISKALEKKGYDSIVAICGAGRGPIVDCAIKAGAINIYVVEKNHAASILLRSRLKNEWTGNIQFFEGDMRTIELPNKIDILVTELLGGFGDNELSPECIEGCERFLGPDSLSIPSSYSSYLVPLTSSFLYTMAYNTNRLNLMSVSSLKGSFFMSNPQGCFEFQHPGTNILYQRKTLEFVSELEAEIHGFGGWFDSVLYDGVSLSSNPTEETSHLRSWFPVFFPIVKPIMVKKGQKIVLSFERKSSKTHVWYEWAVLQPEITPIHNPSGTQFAFGLSPVPIKYK